MKVICNTPIETVCIICRPDLFEKYPLRYFDGFVWRTSSAYENWTDRTKILERVEPRQTCHIEKDGTEKWQFVLKNA